MIRWWLLIVLACFLFYPGRHGYAVEIKDVASHVPLGENIVVEDVRGASNILNGRYSSGAILHHRYFSEDDFRNIVDGNNQWTQFSQWHDLVSISASNVTKNRYIESIGQAVVFQFHMDHARSRYVALTNSKERTLTKFQSPFRYFCTFLSGFSRFSCFLQSLAHVSGLSVHGPKLCHHSPELKDGDNRERKSEIYDSLVWRRGINFLVAAIGASVLGFFGCGWAVSGHRRCLGHCAIGVSVIWFVFADLWFVVGVLH